MGFDIFGYLIFAFVTSITPGPNNYLLFSYGKNYGLKNSSKLMFGIFFGFLVLLYASGYGIAEIITRNPKIELILKIASSVWLFYLAIALSKLSTNVSEKSEPNIGFKEAFFMQFLNPKAWIMAITGASAFLPNFENMHLNVFVFAITFGLVGIPCMIAWIFFGEFISKILKTEKSNKILSIILFGIMLVSIMTIWY
jgi:threonine/homoserine/homoserine lactone efflux protein